MDVFARLAPSLARDRGPWRQLGNLSTYLVSLVWDPVPN